MKLIGNNEQDIKFLSELLVESPLKTNFINIKNNEVSLFLDRYCVELENRDNGFRCFSCITFHNTTVLKKNIINTKKLLFLRSIKKMDNYLIIKFMCNSYFQLKCNDDFFVTFHDLGNKRIYNKMNQF